MVNEYFHKENINLISYFFFFFLLVVLVVMFGWLTSAMESCSG